eukprot:g12238.t1
MKAFPRGRFAPLPAHAGPAIYLISTIRTVDQLVMLEHFLKHSMGLGIPLEQMLITLHSTDNVTSPNYSYPPATSLQQFSEEETHPADPVTEFAIRKAMERALQKHQVKYDIWPQFDHKIG